MTVIEDPGELWSAANPTTVVDRQTHRIGLFYLRCKPECSTYTARPGTDDSQILVRWSADNGVTWSDPTDLTLVARDMQDPKWRITVIGPGGGIQSQSGRLIVPAWIFEPYREFALWSDDHGQTWQRGQFVPGDQSLDEVQLVELADGRILLGMRQSTGTHRWMAISEDQGNTWSAPYAGQHGITRGLCCGAVVRERCSRPARRILWTGPLGPARCTLVLRVSYDQGKTFQNQRFCWTTWRRTPTSASLPTRPLAVSGNVESTRYITFTALTCRLSSQVYRPCWSVLFSPPNVEVAMCVNLRSYV